MFPEGNFLFSTFASAPIPVRTLVIDWEHTWMVVLALLLSSASVLWRLTKPSPEQGRRPRRAWRGVLWPRTQGRSGPALTLPRPARQPHWRSTSQPSTAPR